MAVLELNRVLREAANEGLKPTISIHEDDGLLGKNVQVVEVLLAKQIAIMRANYNKDSAEQEARDLLERLGVEGAQEFSSGDLVELANLIARKDPSL